MEKNIENKPLNERRKMRKREKFSLIFLSIFSIVVGSIAVISIVLYKELKINVETIKDIQKLQYTDHVETRQFLLSTIDWKNRRQKMILFMRDDIVETWKSNGIDIDMQEAYMIAEVNMEEAEKYPHIDPLFHLARQWQESRFNKRALSNMGAIGLNQIMPATGRLLAGFFHLEYHDTLLYNIRISTKFSAKLVDILYAQYGNFEQVLAAYNGGPYQAFYYANEPDKLVQETKSYVSVVIDKWVNLKEKYKLYKVDSSMINIK